MGRFPIDCPECNHSFSIHTDIIDKEIEEILGPDWIFLTIKDTDNDTALVNFQKKIDKLEAGNASLNSLLSANVRVIKKELRKEIDQENKTPDEQV